MKPKNFPRRRETKRKEAEERATERAKLTNEQQLAELDKRNLKATKERARLTKTKEEK